VTQNYRTGKNSVLSNVTFPLLCMSSRTQLLCCFIALEPSILP